MIVDTSFVLDVIDDVDAAVEKEEELEAEAVPLVLPSMTVPVVENTAILFSNGFRESVGV
jgi:predicted nucleic acid-binding protein